MAQEFNEVDVTGKKIVIETKTRDKLLAFVSTDDDPERLELAAKILSWYEEQINVPRPTELDKAAQLWLTEIYAGWLWAGTSRLVEEKGGDDVVRLRLVHNEYDAPTEDDEDSEASQEQTAPTPPSVPVDEDFVT